MTLTHTMTIQGKDEEAIAVTCILTPTHITVVASKSPEDVHTMVAQMPACPNAPDDVWEAWLKHHSVSFEWDTTVFSQLISLYFNLYFKRDEEGRRAGMEGAEL